MYNQGRNQWGCGALGTCATPIKAQTWQLLIKKAKLKTDKWQLLIVLLHDDVTIKTFIKILLFNARDHVRLLGTKQRKFTKKLF